MCNETHPNSLPLKKLAPLTTRSSSSRCVSAAEHHTAEQQSKTCRTKPIKHLPRSNLSSNIRQNFFKIPSLWEAALETERRCFTEAILESNVIPNISRSTDSFSTVPPIVNGVTGDALCVIFRFYPQKVTPLTNLAKVTVLDSTTVTLMPYGISQQTTKWSNWHNRSAYSPKRKKTPRCTDGPKTIPCCTPDTTLTSLLRQPSTITCFDRFDRN